MFPKAKQKKDRQNFVRVEDTTFHIKSLVRFANFTDNARNSREITK